MVQEAREQKIDVLCQLDSHLKENQQLHEKIKVLKQIIKKMQTEMQEENPRTTRVPTEAFETPMARSQSFAGKLFGAVGTSKKDSKPQSSKKRIAEPSPYENVMSERNTDQSQSPPKQKRQQSNSAEYEKNNMSYQQEEQKSFDFNLHRNDEEDLNRDTEKENTAQ